MRLITPVVAAALLLSACGGADADNSAGTGPDSESADSGTVAPVAVAETSSSTNQAGEETRPTVPIGSSESVLEASVGGVPADLLDSVVAAAAESVGAPVDVVEVIRAQQVVWGDASLGCSQPGQSYAQVLTPGYWVVIDADSRPLDYRAAVDGEFSLCLDGGPPVDVLVDRLPAAPTKRLSPGRSRGSGRS